MLKNTELYKTVKVNNIQVLLLNYKVYNYLQAD